MEIHEPIRFHVTGMHCDGCAKRVTKVLERLSDVRAADVSLEHETATVETDEPSPNVRAMISAIESAGYEAKRM